MRPSTNPGRKNRSSSGLRVRTPSVKKTNVRPRRHKPKGNLITSKPRAASKRLSVRYGLPEANVGFKQSKAMYEQHPVSEHHQHTHLKAAHHKHKKEHNNHLFEDQLARAIAHFEGAKTDYSNCLLYPELCMARIPFICPVPTALARGVSIYSFMPDQTVGDTFGFSFVPEAICSPSGNQWHHPFYYGSSASTIDSFALPNF